MIIENHEPITKEYPRNIIYIMTCCGLRDILYNPVVIGLLKCAFLKLIVAILIPIKPTENNIVPTINSMEPILSGVKIIKIKLMRVNNFPTTVKALCSLVQFFLSRSLVDASLEEVLKRMTNIRT